MAAMAALLAAVGIWPLWGGLKEWHWVLRYDFGWSAGQISGAYALIQAGILMALVAGILVDKLGPRRVAFFGLLVLGAGFVLFSQVRELWHLYAVFAAIGLGAVMCSWLPMLTVLNNWFDRRKTMALALVILLAWLGAGLFNFLMSELLSRAFGGIGPDESGRYEWRASALFVGLAYLALAFPLSRLVRNRPEDTGLLPDGDALPPNAGVQTGSGGYPTPDAGWGHNWRQAVRTKDFWLMAIGTAAELVTLSVIFVRVDLFLEARGHSTAMVNNALAVYIPLEMVFLLVGGYLGDRVSMKKLAGAFSAVLALSAVLLALATGTGMVFAFAALFGIGSGGVIAVIISMRGRYFGRKAFATITGVSLVPAIILIWVGGSVASVVKDGTGNYDAAILGLTAISLVGGIAFLMMGEPPRRPQLLASDGPLEQAPAEKTNP